MLIINIFKAYLPNSNLLFSDINQCFLSFGFYFLNDFYFVLLQQRFHASIEQTRCMSEYTNGYLHKLLEESKKLENHAAQANEIQMQSLADFQKSYEVGVLV